MELHISSNDFDYITSIFEEAKARVPQVEGYCSINGTNALGKREYKVFVSKEDLTEAFKTPVTFGQMIDIMKQWPVGQRIYFQREDWQGTPEAVFLDGYYSKIPYISKCYMCPVSDDYYVDEDTGTTIDDIPYIPSFEDMIHKGWYVYNYKKEKKYMEDDGDMVDYGGYSM